MKLLLEVVLCTLRRKNEEIIEDFCYRDDGYIYVITGRV